MKLYVCVIEARNILAMNPNGLRDPYATLRLGRYRFRTKVVKKSLNPVWREEFSFRVDDLKDDLVITIRDVDKYFNNDFVGYVKIPVFRVFDADNGSLGTAWYALRPKNKKSKDKDCGEILLAIYFAQSGAFSESTGSGEYMSLKHCDPSVESNLASFSDMSTMPSPIRLEEIAPLKEEKSSSRKTFAGRFAKIFSRNTDGASTTSSRSIDSTELHEEASVLESDPVQSEDQFSPPDFDEVMKIMESREQGDEIPDNLSGGVLLDQLYQISPSDLNMMLFKPDSNFPRQLAEVQGTTELQLGSWNFDNEGQSLKRVVTYIKGATKLIKAVKSTEDQVYLKADGNVYAVLASVSIPDVMYGSTFRTELLYCIMPGLELPSGEPSSRLVISWRMNFLQSTMMKGMIESGARQGLRDSFELFANFLSQNVKTVDPKDIGSDKEQLLASLQPEPLSDWRLAVQYFANFTMLSTILIGLYVAVHIWLVLPSTIQGLELVRLDLPDSIGEVIVGGILALLGKRSLGLISRFIQARSHKDSDHGVRAQGDGWLLTVALIEGTNLAAVDSSGFSDPYVVFTCNGKTRTSSIKFHNSDPLWNEILEFDAMEDPPSVLDVDVFYFNGSFAEATSLGHAEINFVRTNIADLADFWVPLCGKLAQAFQSKLHLRIFLKNTRGKNVDRDYLSKMEKEVGKKINVRSPQTNSAFQKLFGLPPEEFLIDDFSCHLKRRLLLQGRLFLSARIIGFYANLFGQKTKFFFLWEDIEDIQVISPSLSSMGRPVISMTLKQGRGMDARHGAKTQDEEGRLKFQFQSFLSFNVTHRMIMALWKARSLSSEQKVNTVEEESECKSLVTEEDGSFLGLEDVSLSELHSSVLGVPMSFFMEVFGGEDMERRIMEKAGCLNYSCTPWESEKPDVFERQVYFRFDKRVSHYSGDVTSSQQKSNPSENTWLLEEVMTLHGIPVGDYFNLHLRYQIEDVPLQSRRCNVRMFFGITWLKSSKHQKRISRNLLSHLQDRVKVMLAAVEKEYASRHEN
ncbi:hypothetical protein MLD38_036714 [Melastoma candidum]|uniref:Uncharacterized protein n=1 Tax=Melastoma candidum TaxID=119954 RepID=A0ACB9LKE3_9MYRT|nr:hypothetical protein MLD38_036714 [Melastoma candidum]